MQDAHCLTTFFFHKQFLRVLKLFMEASTCRNMAPMLSPYSFLHWQNVFTFPEFERAQTIRFVSSKVTPVALFLTIHNYFSFFWSM